MFDPTARDNCSEPFLFCQKYFKKKGGFFLTYPERSLNEVDWIVIWDARSIPPQNPYKRIYFYLKNFLYRRDSVNILRVKNPKTKMALVMQEPYCVCPENWDRELHKIFDVIFTWDPTFIRSKKYKIFYLPCANFKKEKTLCYSDKKLICDISNNKIPIARPNAAKERFNIISFFDSNAPSQFDLFGSNWNPSIILWLWKKIKNQKIFLNKVKNWHGPIVSKSSIYKKYKFALCIENSIDKYGYISNKIFDVMHSGCVPVYLGPPDRYRYLANGTFVDVHRFRTYSKLLQYLQKINIKEYERFLLNIKKYLNSKMYAKYTQKEFSKNLFQALK